MSRSGLCRVLVGVAIEFGIIAGAAARELPIQGAPLGVWTTANGGGVIEIGWCGTTLCARIVGIERAPGEPMPKDYRGRPQCGLTFITDVRPTQDGVWLGHLVDPRNGNEYQAQIWVDNTGRLNLRGFIGIPLLGRTEVWRRFTGQLAAGCRIAPA